MDPEETLRLLHEAMESVDRSEYGFPPWEDVKTHLRDLEGWLARGGAAPHWRPLAVPIAVEEVEDDGTWRWLCMYCGKVIPGAVSNRPCPGSPDEQHRRGQRWHPPPD